MDLMMEYGWLNWPSVMRKSQTLVNTLYDETLSLILTLYNTPVEDGRNIAEWFLTRESGTGRRTPYFRSSRTSEIICCTSGGLGGVGSERKVLRVLHP